MRNLKDIFDVVVVGGGPAGYSCALFCSRKGKRTALIEEREVGGVCLNRGCIPTKTVISALKRGINSPEEVERKKKEVVDRLRAGVLSHLKRAGVEIINGTAQFSGEKRLSVQGRTLIAENVVIATGSVPASHPFDSDKVVPGDVAIDEWISSPPSRILVVGGGAIGCEFATIFSKMGSDVTIIEVLEHLLPNIDEDVAKVFERELKKKKVKVITGDKVVEIKDRNALLASGRNLEFDAILWATGRRGNTDNLNLESTGVETNNGWIRVDEGMRTTHPEIYAIGDCNGISLTAYAGYIQAVVVAENITGRKSVYDKEAIPYAVFSDPEVAWVGLTEKVAREKGVDVSCVSVLMRSIGRAHADDELGGVCKLVVEKNGVIKGAQIVGPHASEIVHYMALLIKKGITVEEVSHIHHIHPSFSEVIWECCLKSVDFPLHSE